MVDTSHTPALGCVQVITSRDAATLLPIIRAHIAPGSIIHPDEWRAYSRVDCSAIPHVILLYLNNFNLIITIPCVIFMILIIL